MLQNYRLETSIGNFKYFTAMATLSNSTINVITLEASNNKQWSKSVREVFFEPCDMKATVKDQRIDINYHKPLGWNISSGSHIFKTLQRVLMKLYLFTKLGMIKWSVEFVLFLWKVRKLVDILPACLLVLANDKRPEGQYFTMESLNLVDNECLLFRITVKPKTI